MAARARAVMWSVWPGPMPTRLMRPVVPALRGAVTGVSVVMSFLGTGGGSMARPRSAVQRLFGGGAGVGVPGRGPVVLGDQGRRRTRLAPLLLDEQGCFVEAIHRTDAQQAQRHGARGQRQQRVQVAGFEH